MLENLCVKRKPSASLSSAIRISYQVRYLDSSLRAMLSFWLSWLIFYLGLLSCLACVTYYACMVESSGLKLSEDEKKDIVKATGAHMLKPFAALNQSIVV